DERGGDARALEGVEEGTGLEVRGVEGDRLEPGGGHRLAVAAGAVLDRLVAGELVDEDDALVAEVHEALDDGAGGLAVGGGRVGRLALGSLAAADEREGEVLAQELGEVLGDRKSTRLNSSHVKI